MSIHSTAIVEQGAILGNEVHIWHFCHIRSGAVLEDLVSVGRDVYVDKGVRVRRGTRVQNGVSLYNGLEVGAWCFIGPHATFTNDPHPRAGKHSWRTVKTILHNGMSIGAGAILRCGIEIGAFAMVGAGAVVTKSVPPFTLAVGLPAEDEAKICACAESSFPLHTGYEELLRDCCTQNLSTEVVELARQEIAKLTRAR
jgi:UDP-2-acetamido-3-amino-2,3-dideoxy-glucuronate N-acetyltransferase